MFDEEWEVAELLALPKGKRSREGWERRHEALGCRGCRHADQELVGEAPCCKGSHAEPGPGGECRNKLAIEVGA